MTILFRRSQLEEPATCLKAGMLMAPLMRSASY
jgi:hypothetical protein